MNRVKITVAMATYNGEKYLREQLDSILCQSVLPDEIVISDDGSTDSSINIIKEYQDKYDNIFLYHNEGKHGVEANFFNAFKYSSGEFIFPSDQDDIWKNSKIELMINAFSEDVDIVYAQDDIFNEKGIIAKSNWDIPRIGISMWKNSLAGHACAFRKSVISIYELENKLSWDYKICLYGSISGRVKKINDSLVFWRRHSETLTSFDVISSEDIPQTKYGKLKYCIKQSIKREYSVPFYDYMDARKKYINFLGGGKCFIINILSSQKWYCFIVSGILYAIYEVFNFKANSFRQMVGRISWAFCYPAVFWCEMHKQKWIT